MTVLTQHILVSKCVCSYKNVITTGYGKRYLPPKKKKIGGKMITIIVVVGLKFQQNLYTARSLWNAIRALITLIQQYEHKSVLEL
jgi:hypothetical protein